MYFLVLHIRQVIHDSKYIRITTDKYIIMVDR